MTADLLRRAAAAVRGQDPAIRVVARAEFQDGDLDFGEFVAAMLDDAAENAELLAPGGDLGPEHSNIMVRVAIHKAAVLARRILGEDA
ncbi:hypothetical protein [Oerskovia paurometabola]|uniref:hypothetical protein n=1 Tax=Oerskovia paurometabola TaxID=162170 RepID=UPI00343D0DD3